MSYFNHLKENLEIYHELQRQADTKHVQATTDRINIPDSWDSVDDFAQWYRAAGFPILPPADTKVYVTDITYSTIVFRKGRFQVEMYLMAPDSQVKSHSHNHESKFVFLAGSIAASDDHYPGEAALGGYWPAQGVDSPDPDCGVMGKGTTTVNHNHGIRTLNKGGVFFNVQMWPDPKIPQTSATIEFNGPDMGPLHKNLMRECKSTT